MRKKLTMLMASLLLVVGTAWAQTRVLKLTGEQIGNTYPYALTDEDAAKVFGLTDLTIAVKVNTPASLSGRRALFCTSDPTQNANTSAMGTNSHYVAYGLNGANSGYLASCVASDRYTGGTVSANTEDVVLVYVLNPTNNKFIGYINESEFMNRNFGSYEIATPQMVKEDHPNAKIYIGGGVKANNAAFETFNGTITGVEVYDGVLDAEQVKGVFPVEFAPEAGKMYALKENSTGLFLDIQTLEIHEPGKTTNSLSLNKVPCAIKFVQGTSGWKMENIYGSFAGWNSWNTHIVSSQNAKEWIFEEPEAGLLTIARDDKNYIGWDNNSTPIAGSALYSNAEGDNPTATRLQFVLEEYAAPAFTPVENKPYYLMARPSGLFLDIKTKGINEPNQGTTNNISLSNEPCVVYFEAGSNGKWKLKNANGEYIGRGSRTWNAVIGATHEWTIADINGAIAISSESGKYINIDKKAAGQPLYCDKDLGLQFTLVETETLETYYALKTSDNTYLNFTEVSGTKASFQSAPSYLYMIPSADDYIFRSVEGEIKFVGSAHAWNVTTDFALWNVSEEDKVVTITRAFESEKHLGNQGESTINKGIYTNITTDYNSWQIVKAYPFNVVYELDGEQIDELKVENQIVWDGTKYTIEFNAEGEYADKVITSCTATNGVSPQNVGGVWSASITAATTITVMLGEKSSVPTAFNPEAGKAYILKVKDQDLYLNVRTLGINDPNVDGSNNISLSARPFGAVYFEAGSTTGTWKMKNVNDQYVGLYPNKAWDPVIGAATAHDWTIVLEDGYVTIAREAGKLVNANSVAAGQPLYCDKATALQFELLNFDDVDFIVGTGTRNGDNGIGGTGTIQIKEINDDGLDKMAAGMGWQLEMEVENPNGATYNKWGTPILVIGDNTGTTTFQFYLRSTTNPKDPNRLDMVLSGTDNYITNVGASGDFSVVMIYDGSQLKITTVNKEGTSATTILGASLPEITQFAYGLPTGMNIKRLSIEKLDPEYTLTVGTTPADVTVTYNKEVVEAGATFVESELNVDLFTATEVEGYTWEFVVDKENLTLTLVYTKAEAVENPRAVVELVNRIGGDGTADKFLFVHTPWLNSKQETFVLGADNGKILIQGSTLSAITTGLGWYLNNVAHINIAWNSLNEKTATGGAYVDLTNIELPTPAEETHTSDAKYRYYLNYCTFGYSMTSWTWKRWQQEIDWMALHGINMPLQIVGLEEVWRKFLTEYCGYTNNDAKAFVAGPAFTAWWGMNNLEGWGGTGTDGWGGVQDDAWYARQANLAKNIGDRQRELGMQPVLPGFSGMVPTNFTEKTTIPTDQNGNNWGGFHRPHIIDPDYADFANVAANYYKCLAEVMGTSQYYSMDPFHEDGVLSSNGTEARYAKGYRNIYDAMEVAMPGSQWVIQQWQWKWYQKVSISAVPEGKLIVLDLFSDGKPAFDSYNGYAPQEAVFCAIPNFGGRSGLMGRLQNVTDNYFKFKGKYTSIKGIGTAPEAIEQTPVTYDLIYQLPWMNGKKPNVEEWVNNYSIARYGKDNAVVKEAWSLLRQGPLAYGADGIQGPVEDVWAARPNLEAYAASTWGSTLSRGYNIPAPENTYNAERRQMLIDAVYKLIDQEDELALAEGSVYESNYLYDIVEFGGAVIADYAHYLLLAIKEAKDANNTTLYEARRDAFLQLILDMDDFRGTNLNFRLGKWTQEARDAAKEVTGAKTATADWYEFNNARTLITTWGDQSQNSGLKDYSYRSWQGLLADYYYPRWKYYFEHDCTDPASGYFFFEWNWAHGMTHAVGDTQKSTTPLTEGQTGYSYSRNPKGNTIESAKAMLQKYIIPVKMNDGSTYYAYRTFTTDLTGKATVTVPAGATVDFTQYFDVPADATVTGDFVNNSDKSALITAVPVTNTSDTYTGTITLTDGTKLENFSVVLKANLLNGVYNIKLVTDWGNTPVFIKYHANDYKMVATSDGLSTNDELDKWFTITPAGNGYTISAQGKYLKKPTIWQNVVFSNNKDDAGIYLFNDSDTEGIYKLTASDATHLQAWSYILSNVPADQTASTFIIEQKTSFPIAMSRDGYATIFLPFNVTLPEGVHAYDICSDKLNNNTEDILTLIAGPGETLAAGTPAILEGKENSYNLSITLNSNGAKTGKTNSVLQGSYVKHTLEVSNKTFVFQGNGFSSISKNTELAANTCWVETNTEINATDIDIAQPNYIKIGDWKFKVKKTGKGLTITECVESGKGHLEIGSNYKLLNDSEGPAYEVIAISDNLLAGNANLTEVTLPATLTSVGSGYANFMFEMEYEGADYGAGTKVGEPATEDVADKNAAQAIADAWVGTPHACKYDILGTSTWRMTATITKSANSTHFNKFGSCLFATKENTLANAYKDKSMQLYLRDDKGITFKLDSNEDSHVFNKGNHKGLGNEFELTFILENDGAGGYLAKMKYADETEETFEILATDEAELKDFNTIWSSLGSGIKVKVRFDKLTNKGLFVGCKNLTAIHVDSNNPSFTACKHGVLYNKAMTHIIRFPEGGGETIDDCDIEGEEGHRHFETPRSVTMVYAGALHGVNAHIVFHSNPLIMMVAGHEEHMIAKYHLVIDDDADVIDFNSNNANTFETVEYKRAFNAPGTYGTIMLPFVPNEESLSKITFFEFENGDDNTLTFKEVTDVQPNTPYLFTMKEDGITSLEGGVTTITAVTNYTSENTNGNWTSVGCYKTGTVITNNEGETNSFYGLNNSKQFVRVSKKINTKPYRAYYKMAPGAGAPAAKFSLIFRDGSTEVIAPSQVEGWEENIYYDLMGRRVLNPTNGIYIVNGKKVIVK